mmetsp:Transcript_6951/g.23749  ORF Transcript_6951/g.23749 Transcript_6951/m.23749 type:complete len:305 (+) Transcript_6951:808-1722(+)
MPGVEHEDHLADGPLERGHELQVPPHGQLPGAEHVHPEEGGRRVERVRPHVLVQGIQEPQEGALLGVAHVHGGLGGGEAGGVQRAAHEVLREGHVRVAHDAVHDGHHVGRRHVGGDAAPGGKLAQRPGREAQGAVGVLPGLHLGGGRGRGPHSPPHPDDGRLGPVPEPLAHQAQRPPEAAHANGPEGVHLHVARGVGRQLVEEADCELAPGPVGRPGHGEAHGKREHAQRQRGGHHGLESPVGGGLPQEAVEARHGHHGEHEGHEREQHADIHQLEHEDRRVISHKEDDRQRQIKADHDHREEG